MARWILADYLAQPPEPWLYQRFKRHFLAPLPQDGGWQITGAEIAAWLAQQEEP